MDPVHTPTTASAHVDGVNGLGDDRHRESDLHDLGHRTKRAAATSPLPIYCLGIDKSVQLQYTPAAGRRAFVTAATWLPSGGTVGADTTCQAAADAKTLARNVARPDRHQRPRAQRVGSARPASPWVRLDGIPISATPDVLLNGQILDVPLNLHRDRPVPRQQSRARPAQTSTTAAWRSQLDGLDWTDATMANTQRVGLLNSITLYFSTPIFQTCSGGGQLYCLEP